MVLEMDPWRSGMRLPGRAGLRGMVAVGTLSLAASTLAIAILRAGAQGLHASYPAPVYLLAVLVVGMRYGTIPAVLTSVAAFLLYDFLFVEPLYTFTINSPDEWLNLVLLLVVAVVIGRLVALLADRATEAADRAREAEALYSITGILASTGTVDVAAPTIASRLEELTGMERVWVGLGSTPGEERFIADTAWGQPLPAPGWHVVLQRAAEGRPHWVRSHVLSPGPRRAPRAALYRVRVAVAGETLGSLWGLRSPERGEPDGAETRILSAAADQLGQAVVRDRLTAEATVAEIARQSEAVKTALLDSVSHDLRTPLATIRATAGSMLDPAVSWSEEDRQEAFESIDSEAERMGRLVRNLLDLSRIEGGALRPELEVRDLGDLVEDVVSRYLHTGRAIVSAIEDGMPHVLVDEVFLGQVVANLLENAIRYGGPRIEVRTRTIAETAAVELRVEDDGEGVPEAALDRLFEKFYQVPHSTGGRRGMGIGLTVVAGMVIAMGGSVRAERSDLGGLAVIVTLPATDIPGDEVAETTSAEPGAAATSAARSAGARRAAAAARAARGRGRDR